MRYDACKKKLALQFPDDRRSYTEGKGMHRMPAERSICLGTASGYIEKGKRR